ncbi:MAG: hypothetical protein JSS49_26340 [Planctomycetes bacterium]|nr:hypothetical protein [Planctomycetota bacterium]
MQWPRLAVEVLPLLTTISPLIGVATILVLSRWNSALARPMALSNATVALLLAAATVWSLPGDPTDSAAARPQHIEPGITWLTESSGSDHVLERAPRGFRVRLAFGHEGLSAWSALLLSLTVWAILWCPGRVEAAAFPKYCVGLLTSQTLLLASIYSTDAITAILFVELALLPLHLLVGASGDDGRRTAAGSWWLWQFVGCSISLLGVTLLAVSQPWMISDLVVHRGPVQLDTAALAENLRQSLARSETALHLWNDLGSWGAVLLTAGFLIRLPVFPFHEWYRSTVLTAPTGISAVIAVAFPLIAFNGWLRLGMPVFGQNNPVLGGVLGMLAMLGALQSGLMALSKTDIKRLVISLSCTMLCLTCIGLSFQTRDGSRGAWLLILAHGLTVALGMLLVQVLESRFGTSDLDHLPNLMSHSPRLATALAILFLGWAGIPAATGFAALYLQHSNPAGARVWLIAGESVALIAQASASIRIFARLRTDSPEAACRSRINLAGTDLNTLEVAILSPFVALLVVLNVAPGVIMHTCETVFRSKL